MGLDASRDGIARCLMILSVPSLVGRRFRESCQNVLGARRARFSLGIGLRMQMYWEVLPTESRKWQEPYLKNLFWVQSLEALAP